MSRTGDSLLKLDIERSDSSVVMRVCGSVTIAEADKLQMQLESLAEEGVPLIILDIGRMDFICSAGLGAIISGYLKSRNRNGKVCLVNPQQAVQELLETTCLTRLFSIYQTIEQALSS